VISGANLSVPHARFERSDVNGVMACGADPKGPCCGLEGSTGAGRLSALQEDENP